MIDTAEMLAPQPPPTGNGRSVTDLALERIEHPFCRELLLARRQQGIERYGTELRTGNGRCTKADLLQELVDGLIYAVLLEHEVGPGMVPGYVEDLLEIVVDLVDWWPDLAASQP